MLAPGDALGPLSVPAVRVEALRELAVVLDDPNPIHTEGERPVVQGPASFGWVLDMLAAAAPGAHVAALDVQLRGSVLAGDALSAAGIVDEADGRELTCSVWLDVDGGGRVLEGTARLVLEGA